MPMVKAVLHSLNTRLDAAVIAFQLDHAESRIVIVDREFSGVMKEALALAEVKPLVIDYDDPEYPADAPIRRASGSARSTMRPSCSPAIRISPGRCPTTSGTQSRSTTRPALPVIPKGVVYHHRGAALMAHTNTIHAGMGKHAVYLWTLPMFHCNGWCFPWTLAVQAGTHVCLRWVRAEGDVRRHRRPQSHASLRRTDRHGDADQRRGEGQARLLAAG